jgi:hypothetical protein
VEADPVSQKDEFRSKCNYYGDNCQQRLYRTQLSHELALRHLGEALNSGLGVELAPLLDKALSAKDRKEPRLSEKLVRIIVESHFLTLKVNFEYFLNRMLYCLWWWQFEQLAHRSRVKVPLRYGAHMLSNEEARERVIDSVIPRHGLGSLKDSFKKVTDKSLPEELNARSKGLWDQINTAFEVRHLVEHCDGKVNEDFRHHVKWQCSSWSDFPMSVPERIQVRRKDFDVTLGAMKQAAEIITTLTSDCWLG